MNAQQLMEFKRRQIQDQLRMNDSRSRERFTDNNNNDTADTADTTDISDGAVMMDTDPLDDDNAQEDTSGSGIPRYNTY